MNKESIIEVDLKSYKDTIEKEVQPLSRELREANRGMLQVLIPLDVTLLLGVLGLGHALNLYSSSSSKILTTASCICFLTSLILFIFGAAFLLLNFVNSGDHLLREYMHCLLAERLGKNSISIKDRRLFVNPLGIILGFITFILGVLNLSFALVTVLYNDFPIWLVGGSNIFLLILTLKFIPANLKRNVTLSTYLKELKQEAEQNLKQ